MATKKQLDAEVAAIWAQLYQERQDHGDYVRQLRNREYNMARESMRVRRVIVHRHGYYEELQIVNIEESTGGVSVEVSNVEITGRGAVNED